MKSLPTKTAFLHKNFRDLKFELKVVFLMHLLTVVFCFMPWVSYSPLYGSSYYENAFGGTIKLMGVLIFLISLAVCFIFADKLFKTKKIKLPVAENLIFIFAGIQQIILIVCAWSVLMFMSGGFNLMETRFGIIFCLFFQIFGVVAAYLLTRDKQRKEVVDFFHQAEKKIEKQAHNLFNKTENTTKK